MKSLKGAIYCFIAALFWGVAFVAQDVSTELVEPFTFTAVRMTLGGATIALLLLFRSLANRRKKDKQEPPQKTSVPMLLIGGIVCGLCMTVATVTQQIGLQYTTAGKSGFITACYIILVPIFGLFLKRKCPFFVWISLVLAIVGLYFLCMKGGFSGFGKGDLITLGCSVAFAVHILVIDYFVRRVDGMALACLQCFVCALAAAACMLVTEHPVWDNLLKAWLPVLYTGIFSAGLAYMFQILGQKNLNPTVASIVMSLESVVSVVAAWIILKQAMSAREVIGCVILFAAIILAQLPQKKKEIKVLY